MYLTKTKAQISCVQLICTFDFAYSKRRFSHDTAQEFNDGGYFAIVYI